MKYRYSEPLSRNPEAIKLVFIDNDMVSTRRELGMCGAAIAKAFYPAIDVVCDRTPLPASEAWLLSRIEPIGSLLPGITEIVEKHAQPAHPQDVRSAAPVVMGRAA